MLNVIGEIQALREAGQKEYAHEDDNSFRNFDRLSEDLGISRAQVLWVYLKKHLDGILAHIKGHTSQRENVRGRINDAITYLVLLRAMEDEADGVRFPIHGDVTSHKFGSYEETAVHRRARAIVHEYDALLDGTWAQKYAPNGLLRAEPLSPAEAMREVYGDSADPLLRDS
jgi:hypothetical protein